MIRIEMGIKFYVYQTIGVLIIWLGMTYFWEDIHSEGKIIYYAVTSWLLFLIVLTVKKFFQDRKRDKQEK